MALPFDLTEDAVLDLEQAGIFLAHESEPAALRLADDLEAAFQFIPHWPNCGHRRSDLILHDDIRFWSAAGYLIAYRAIVPPVLIIGVLHGARGAASILDLRLEDQ